MPLPTAVESAEFERYARQVALLKLAAPHMSRLDAEDLEALCDLASDDAGMSLAEMVLHPSLRVLHGP
jgi:hypothetical protein